MPAFTGPTSDDLDHFRFSKMKCTFLVGMLVATSVVATTNDRCHLFNNKDACLGSSEGKPCYWCASAAVPSSCFDEDEAAQLPPAVFQCMKEDATPANSGCHFYNSEASCQQNTEGDKPCYWCKSAAVPSQCYNETEAEQLPPAVFQCDMKKKSLVFEADVVDLAAVTTDAFISSAAVPSMCYNETEAKLLPPAIFQCDKEDSIKWALTEMPSQNALNSLFQQWQAKHGVAYLSAEEHQQRTATFHENAHAVAAHNQHPLKRYSLELNQFADTTWDEFKQLYLGVSSPQNCSATHTARTFSSTGSLESHNLLTHGKKVLLSEQNLVDCAQAFDNHGCSGGLPSHAFEYIKYNGGLDTGAVVPSHVDLVVA
ncbi:hypothetical protein DYB28_005014 [Aphanomyces astaci]|uniref:Cathepsin propeptide inhibitor domain-containing protein n=1 Tax=Aphanomyces astaci TaxID=112090 RepID=A0A9X8E0H1_APHAT|nr:hypothetical protein DYB28_005014 [Aphanomyces astaci]